MREIEYKLEFKESSGFYECKTPCINKNSTGLAGSFWCFENCKFNKGRGVKYDYSILCSFPLYSSEVHK